jgi:hypothetical protein
MGHAREERVLLFGTDQQITSGPAAKRPHSNALGEDVELRIRATLAEARLADLRSSLDALSLTKESCPACSPLQFQHSNWATGEFTLKEGRDVASSGWYGPACVGPNLVLASLHFAPHAMPQLNPYSGCAISGDGGRRGPSA